MAIKKTFTNESLATFIDEIKSYTNEAVSTKSDSNHTHDERYYTESEVDEIIAAHTHSYDDLRNKPFYEGTDYSSILQNDEITANFYSWGGNVYGAAIADAPKTFIQDTSYKVIWDGFEYTLTSTFSGNNEAGNPITSLGAPYGSYSTYPFGIDSYKNASGVTEFSIHTNSTDATHTIDVLELGSSFVTLDDRFISDNIARTSVVEDIETDLAEINTFVNNVPTTYETKTDASSKLAEAKSYTDNAVSGKANSSHTHSIANITNLQSTLDGKAASSHNHNASNINAGTLSSDRLPTVPITKGGTGSTTAAGALTNLGITATASELNKLDGVTATTTELNYVDGVTSNIQTQLDGKAASSHNHSAANITSGTLSSDRLSTVPISKGGTGATTASGALTNLGITATANELNVLDGITATVTELNYVDGVTSKIQTQLDGKLSTSGGSINGPLAINSSNSSGNGLIIRRNASASEQVVHTVDDATYKIKYTNDEKTNNVTFELTNTDTEGSDGSGANTSTVTINGSASGSKVTANQFVGSLSGNATSAIKAIQDGNGKTISSTYETKADATSKLNSAKTYADSAATTAATNVKNELLNGAGAAYDTLKELGDLINDNVDAIDALEAVAANKADKNHTHAGTGDYSTFIGANTTVSGNQSTALGQGATITNVNVTTVGQGVTATSDNVTALGQATIASGSNTIAIGQSSKASGENSISIGQTSEASGDYSIAIGQATIAASDYSTIIGQYASGGISTTVVGQGANTEGDYAVIIGSGASAIGDCATVIGQGASAAGAKAIAIGIGATAAGNSAVVLGSDLIASGDYSFATGYNNEATGNYSHVEGVDTKATDYAAHAEGDRTEASSTGAHAEGQSTVASGLQAHAEGRGSVASGSGSHAEGMGTTASATGTHAEGTGSTASGINCHAEGANTLAKGFNTHAEGEGTIASGSNQHVQGRYNIEGEYQFAHIVGNGSSKDARSNMHTLDWQGNAWYSGDVLVGGTGMTSGASRVTTEADHSWNLIYDSGFITSAVNSFANIDISGYKNFMVAVSNINNGNPGTRAGVVIFKATNGTTYQFPVWGNMFSASNVGCGGMAEFKFIDGYIICPNANRVISNSNFLKNTEGGTAVNLIGQGGGIMKCTNTISTITVSNQDQNSTYFFGVGSRLMIWGWNA